MKNSVINFSSDVRAKETRAVYYVVTFITDFAFSTMSATYVLFLLSQGLDLLQVNLVNLVFMAGIFFLEVPTGAFADHFGRKKSIILSNVFIIFAFSTYFFSASLLMFIIAETLAAIGYTFESGALDAWLVDSLQARDFTGKFDFIFSHASIISKIASLLGGLIGAYIGAVNLRFPMGFGAVLTVFALFASIFLIKEKFEPKINKGFRNNFINMGKIAKSGMIYSLKHKVILWLIIAGVLANFAFQPLNMYWSPRLNNLAGNQVWLLGWVWAGMCLTMMLGGILVKKFLQKEKSYLWISIMMVLFLAIPILFASVSNIFPVVLSVFLIYEIGRGMHFPMQKNYLNKYARSENRATVLSFNSMISRVGAAGGLVILGWVARTWNIQTSWFLSAVLLLFLIPIFLRVGHHEKGVGERGDNVIVTS